MVAVKKSVITRKEFVGNGHSSRGRGYTGDMSGVRTGSGLLRRGWSRLLDGDRAWGSIEVRPDRFGVTRYRLVVFPPGISEPERRRVRVARGWPMWGALVWVFCEISLSDLTGPVTALVTSTATLHKLDSLAGALLEADELLARGEIPVTTHEMTWWRVYNQMDPANVAA